MISLIGVSSDMGSESGSMTDSQIRGQVHSGLPRASASRSPHINQILTISINITMTSTVPRRENTETGVAAEAGREIDADTDVAATEESTRTTTCIIQRCIAATLVPVTTETRSGQKHLSPSRTYISDDLCDLIW